MNVFIQSFTKLRIGVTTMPNELKPCPFCGGKATTSHGVAVTTEHFFFVSCEKCHSRTGNAYKWQYGENYEQKAIEAWNRRADNGTI